jgi:hypothetical protein
MLNLIDSYSILFQETMHLLLSPFQKKVEKALMNMQYWNFTAM